MYARRWSSTTRRRSTPDSSLHGRPSGVARSPASKAAISAAIGRALRWSVSYHELKICRKIHWVHR
jgi:hypothetical protein